MAAKNAVLDIHGYSFLSMIPSYIELISRPLTPKIEHVLMLCISRSKQLLLIATED